MRVGIVGDLHLPFVHPRYLDFICDTFEAWSVDTIYLAGDVVDQHALGFWEHDPDGLSASSELDEAVRLIQQWHTALGEVTVSIGNHDARHVRTAKKAGIPSRYLRSYSDIFGTPNWKWVMSDVVDGVLYEHGTGSSGKFAAYNRALQKRQSVVIGHCHSGGGVLYHCNETSRIFGLNVGCGIDVERYAFEYGRPFPIRPTLGCGVVLDGDQAIFEPMLIGKGERYRRTKKRRRRC